MDEWITKVRTFLGDMTFWNWIALIAFCLLPFSTVNALLSLKSRYLNWRGTKSKKKFEKRLRELETQITRIAEYRADSAMFFRHVIQYFTRLILLFLWMGFLFMTAFVTSTILFVLALPLLLVALNVALRLYRLVRNVNHPQVFANEVVEFIFHGQSKGFIPAGQHRLFTLLEGNHMLSLGSDSYMHARMAMQEARNIERDKQEVGRIG